MRLPTLAVRIRDIKDINTNNVIKGNITDLSYLPCIGNILKMELFKNENDINKTTHDFIVSKRIFYNLNNEKDFSWDFKLILNSLGNSETNYQKIIIDCKIHFFTTSDREYYKKNNFLLVLTENVTQKFYFAEIPNNEMDFLNVGEDYYQFINLEHDLTNGDAHIHTKFFGNYDLILST